MAGSGSKKTQFPTRRANANARVRQQVKQILNARRELKYVVNTGSGTLSQSGEVISHTQPIILGDDPKERTGVQIQVKHLMVNLRFVLNSTSETIRIIHFQDKHNTGTLPAVTDVLTDATPQSALSGDVVVTKRFKILDDRYVRLSDAGDNQRFISRYEVKFNDLIVTYNAETDVSGANGANAIFWLMVSDLGSTNAGYLYSNGIGYYDS